jgi:hypothetical protein
MRLPLALIVASNLVCVACEIVGPSFGAREGVLFYLNIDPDVVAPAGAFAATLKIENTSDDTVEVHTGCGGPGLSVWGTTGSRFRVDPSNDVICVAIVFPPRLLAPQDSMSWGWEVQAGVPEVPAEVGRYKVRVEFHPNNHFPVLEHRFWVR